MGDLNKAMQKIGEGMNVVKASQATREGLKQSQ